MPLFSPRWKYCRRVNYSGCDQEIYQQDLVVHRSSGRDYEETSCGLKIWHIYVGLQCRADYGDLRFTDRIGTELSYYLWPDFDGSGARICVRLEGATSAGAVMIRYGNSVAVTTSDGDATYGFFDHFEGAVLNAEKWSKSSGVSATVSDSVVRVSSSGNSGIHSTTATFIASQSIVEWKVTKYEGYGGYVGINTPLYSSVGFLIGRGGTGTSNDYSMGLNRGNAYTLILNNCSYRAYYSGNYMHIYVNGTDYPWDCTGRIDTSNQLSLKIQANSSAPIQVDYVFVRAYSATPPALLLTSHGLLRPPLGAYLTVTPPGEFIPTPQTISGLYRIRTHVLQEAPYQVCLPLPVESSFHIYLKSLHEAPYQLILKSEQVGPYDIPGGSNLQGIYSIVSPLALEYGVHIGEQVLRDCFYGARIVQKLNQMGTAELDLVYDYVDDAAQPLVRQGAEIRVLYNDLVRFSGEIRKITKDDTSGVWHLVCESGACHLSDRSTETIVEYEAIPSDAIVRALLPSSAWEGDIAPGPKINYKTEYADLLSHIINLSDITGHDWRVRQQEDYFQVSGVTATTITVAGSTWGTDRYADRYLLVVSGGGKWTSFRVATNTADQLVIYPGANLLDAGLRVGDAFRIFRDFKLDMGERIGSPEPVITLRINDDLFWSERTQDIDRVKNRIIVTGTSSLTQDRNSSIAGCTLTTTILESSESVLGQNIDTDQTTIYIVSPEGYPPSGVVSIDAERIAYASISGTTFTGCTRGYGGTSPAGHNIRSEVVLTSELRVASTAGFPNSGYIRIGMEQMAYTSTSPTSFKGLTRGTSGTEVYAHAVGILVRYDAYSAMAPETGTSIDLYGIREKIVPALGVTDQNTLDRLAQKQLLVLQDLQEWGTGTLAATSFNAEVDVGDEIAVMESDGSLTTNYRLVGVTHDQNSGLISIEYGAIEEYFLDDLSRLQSGIELANARGAVASLGTVVSVSSNGEMALVYLDRGKSVWCRVK